MSSHTPGPWEWWTSNSWRRLRSNPSNGRDVGVCVPFVARDGHPDLEVSAADMALIAAAPGMLDALRAVAAEVSPHQRPHSTDSYLPQHIVDLITASIAKAESRA